MTPEQIAEYQRIISQPDRFNQIPEFTRQTIVRVLVSAGVEVSSELVNRYIKPLEDAVWQKSET